MTNRHLPPAWYAELYWHCALGFAIVLGMGWSSLTPLAPFSEVVLFVPVPIILVFLLEALPEELAFRGYIQGNLERPLGYLTRDISLNFSARCRN